MELNDIVKEAYQTARDKGWHDIPRSPLEVHMLIVSEIAEATEAWRKDGHVSSVPFDGESKPEGEQIELADALIRICDYFGAMGWDLEAAVASKMNYNKTRSYRHGGKNA